MSNDTVIHVENLSKAYRIGLREEIPDTLLAAAANLLTAPWRNFRQIRRLNTFLASDEAHAEKDQHAGNGSNGHGGQVGARRSSSASDTIWALRDVSFEVRRGEVVGIIGRNGAGKSTLLKILSRITEPTCGRAVIHGRVASLLEVGTGFHPDLSGRENVYMNGTILGMTKREIDRKFDEIVDFSGVEMFIDTPIKRYSSGMKVRLAFAVAAHLEPEVMIVDEVLAVGDAEFQKKCLGKMHDVATDGRTVLFVSHNLGAVRGLCTRGLVLQAGALAVDAPVDEAVQGYLAKGAATGETCLLQHPNRRAGSTPLISGFRMYSRGDQRVEEVLVGDPVVFEVAIHAPGRELGNAVLGISIEDLYGQCICTFASHAQSPHPLDLQHGDRPRCHWDRCLLAPGRYRINVSVRSGEWKDTIDAVTELQVNAADFYGTGRTHLLKQGAWMTEADWRIWRGSPQTSG